MTADQATAEKLIDMIMNYSRAQLVRTAVELGIADRLAGGPRTSGELNEEIGGHPDALSRFLKACTAIGLLEEPEPERFALAPLGEFLRTDTHAGSAISKVALGAAGPGMYRMGEFFTEVVMTGKPVAKSAFGLDFYDYYAANTTEGTRFGDMMALMTHGCAEALATTFDFGPYRKIVDVGGGHGMLLSRILQAAPHTTGVVYDMPETVAGARRYLEEQGLADRAECVAGDFHSELPSGGDLYTIKTVLCDWDDEHVARILANLYRATTPGTDVLLIDWIMPADAYGNKDFLIGLYLGSFNMLAQSGGKIRNLAEWTRLIEGAGFEISDTLTLPDPPTHWDVLKLSRR
ncbi:acetylserotonin O-methyltransferase [Sphaerisporangium perillae]|uniref:acetylserotonin O-methyltransferase n=1 Tax=Sphaerisporangium perillae TaxID=2935860 RepID=UPI00200DD79A|nr:acetylserotonin O-methyltransferase [Sphaerisporangium perillae]